MWIKKIDNANKRIIMTFPVRAARYNLILRKDDKDSDYPIVKVRDESVPKNAWCDWMIGYAVKSKTSLGDTKADGYDKDINGALELELGDKKLKSWELSDIIFYACQTGLVSKNELSKIKGEISKTSDFVEESLRSKLKQDKPARTGRGTKIIFNMEFGFEEFKSVKRYIRLYKEINKNYKLDIELLPRGYAQGIGAIVRVWFRISELNSSIIGRTARAKETADFIIDSKNIGIFLEMLKIFGILSKSHNHDIRTIIDKVAEA
ncbi:MAG: R.Pab1 family restriction endonuclease [Rickettsiales bacterium]|jgi:hypothetical protein|nr:R.Pab1 family restriction endonuclease [Rickettsiales bacterium]